MTQEQRELLIKDLCGRLLYGVKFRYKYIDECFREKYDTSILEGVVPPYHIIHSTLVGEEYLKIEEDEVKPYLFPLSSMTEEQREEIEDKLIFPNNSDGGWIEILHNNKYEIPFWFVDFCNKNHLDYRCLIPMGLAIDATDKKIY